MDVDKNANISAAVRIRCQRSRTKMQSLNPLLLGKSATFYVIPFRIDSQKTAAQLTETSILF